MFICNVLLEVPLKLKGPPTTSPLLFTVAKYNYVPPLQLGDEIQINNWGIGDWSDEPLTFIAAFTKNCERANAGAVNANSRTDECSRSRLPVVI